MKLNHLYLGNNIDVIKTFPDNSVDAIITDSPYGLGKEPDAIKCLQDWIDHGYHDVKGSGFMGKHWDAFVPQPVLWKECFRVLKPGGHLLSFFGTRTYDWGTLAIRLAGFEIRDCVMWIYAQGFPKSLDINKQFCNCDKTTEQKTEHILQPMQKTDIQTEKSSEPAEKNSLQQILQEQNISESGAEGEKPKTDGIEKSSVEGWGDNVQKERELQKRNLCTSAEMGNPDVPKGRIYNAAQADNGNHVQPIAKPDGGSTPQGSQPKQQRSKQFGALAGQQFAQENGTREHCNRCGKPATDAAKQWNGYGTALKPACEPICVARKPLEGTVIENVLKYGTGGINIDAGRVGTEELKTQAKVKGESFTSVGNSQGFNGTPESVHTGRWPANIIHDGSDEVLAGFPEAKGQQNQLTGNEPTANGFSGAVKFGGMKKRVSFPPPRADSDSAARFFYCAKTSPAERAGRKHPTIKPLALMEYLVRVFCPAGGIVLDPFIGSGTTAIACTNTSHKWVGIEADPENYREAKNFIFDGL